MPLLEKDRCHETEIALDECLCQFLNEAGDPFDPTEEWLKGVGYAIKDLSEAYNNWYKWKKGG